MPVEIERKFLVKGERWRTLGKGRRYRQGYLCTVPARTVRVRLAGDEGFITIKGESSGAQRAEYEYMIPADDAEAMLTDLCERPLIDKTRYRIEYQGLVWEVDEFDGENRGLVIAEVELDTADQRVDLPDWVGAEVTEDPRYYNASLVAHPFSKWAP